MILKSDTRVSFHLLIAFLVYGLLSLPAAAQDFGGPGDDPDYPNTNAKDMDGDMPFRVQDVNTAIPVLWIIKDADQFLAEVDEMKYVVLYDVSDGYDPPGDWDNALSSHVVYYHAFNDMEINQGYWYWMTTQFENDGSYNGGQANGTPLTPANLGYFAGDTISFTLRLYGKDGIWPFYTDVKLDQDLKVHVGEAPLPTLPRWYWGDLHNHSWKTDNLLEYGDPTDGKALAAAAMGLSFVTITDHASDLSTSKWNALGNECSLYSTPTLRLIRGQEMHANQGGLANVRHLLGYDLTTYVEGDEDGTYTINQILGGPSPANNLLAQAAFAYASHPTDPSLGWSYTEMEEALNYPTFVGLEFFNERNSHWSANDWSDDDDEYHPWGGDESLDPHNRDWTITDTGWDSDLAQGVTHWDHLLSDRLAPMRKIFMSGGSDAHGGWNYRVHRTSNLIDLAASASAMGKVRTAVYLPQGLDDGDILDSLRHGRSVVTDGPAMVFGMDGNGDGGIYGARDALIGDGPVEVAKNNGSARFKFLWKSTGEYGDVVYIRLLRGSASTGENPVVVWEAYPFSYDGQMDGPLVSSLLLALDETVYFRAEAFTYDPKGPAVPSGEVSNFTYDAAANDYRYRCFTNPIWFTAVRPEVREPRVSGNMTPHP